MASFGSGLLGPLYLVVLEGAVSSPLPQQTRHVVETEQHQCQSEGDVE